MTCATMADAMPSLIASSPYSAPVTAAAISRHLSVLKEADLVRDKREGQFIFYELNVSVLEEIMLWVSELKGDQSNEKQLSIPRN